MPRDLPISNGRLMISFDHEYNIRDIYYPHVGQENQTIGDVSFFGIWCDGRFAWIGSPELERQLEYEEETLVTHVRVRWPAMSLEVTIRDAVDFDRDLFIRNVEIRNLLPTRRTVRLYVHFDSHLWGNTIGDTIYYDPEQRSLIAYKGQRWVLMNAAVADSYGFGAFAIGTKEREGFQGTWRDAEDGQLGGNAIAQGSVDSTGMIEFPVPPDGGEIAWVWWAFGKNHDEVTSLDKLVRSRGASTFLERTRGYWRLWLNHEENRHLDVLPLTVRALYKRSLLVMRTHVDHGGAVLAATDSDIVQFGRDTYNYMWPRDGALVTTAFIEAGFADVARRFFHFCRPLLTAEGFLLHKYNPDGSLGSSWHPWMTSEGKPQLPIQEDETALVVWALWNHYKKFQDVEYLRPLYRPLVKNAADFLARYREPHTRLPAGSYDLWEERRGIVTFTVAAVWAGLQASANFCEAFGETDLSRRYRIAADEIREAALEHLFDAQRNRFFRMITVSREGAITTDSTIDASLAGIWQLGMLPHDDPRVVSTMEQVIARLTVQTPIGGVARYENDYYHQVSKDIGLVPGNPWIICTAWIAEWHAARATNREELQKAISVLEWIAARALPSGVLPEQIDPYSGKPLSVSPLTWSHSAYVMAVHRVVDRIKAL